MFQLIFGLFILAISAYSITGFIILVRIFLKHGGEDLDLVDQKYFEHHPFHRLWRHIRRIDPKYRLDGYKSEIREAWDSYYKLQQSLANKEMKKLIEPVLKSTKRLIKEKLPKLLRQRRELEKMIALAKENNNKLKNSPNKELLMQSIRNLEIAEAEKNEIQQEIDSVLSEINALPSQLITLVSTCQNSKEVNEIVLAIQTEILCLVQAQREVASLKPMPLNPIESTGPSITDVPIQSSKDEKPDRIKKAKKQKTL